MKLYTNAKEKQARKVDISEDSSLSMDDLDKPTKMIEKIVDDDTQIVTNDDLLTKVFTYDDCDVLVIRDDAGEYWYKAKDIATILEYANTNAATINNVDKKYKKSFANLGVNRNDPLKIDPQTIFIDESGFFQLVARSKKQEAVELWRQITKEILPTLFRTGRYEMPITNSDIAELTKSFYDDNFLSNFIGYSCVYLSYVGQHKVIIDGITRLEHVIKYGNTLEMEKRDLDQHRKFYKIFNVLAIWTPMAHIIVEKIIGLNFKSVNIAVDLKIKGINKLKEENKREHIILTQKHNLKYCIDMIEDVVNNTKLPQEEKYIKTIRHLKYKNKILSNQHIYDAKLIERLEDSVSNLKDNLDDLRNGGMIKNKDIPSKK
jgi:prophage antirepressor-like protein